MGALVGPQVGPVSSVGPSPAAAQDGDGDQALAAAAGGAGGLLAGVVVTVGWVVQQATFEEKYVHSVRDLVSPIGAPLVVAPIAGAGLGFVDQDLLRSAGIGAGIGLVSGAGAGVAAGHLLGGESVDRWAGGLMGAGVGVVLGAAAGALVADDGDDPEGPGAGVPLGLTLRF